jgi:type I restriction enzyme, R subunit
MLFIHDEKCGLAALDKMLTDANLGPPENYAAARSEGLGLFIRSLVGLDRQAAVKAFDTFLAGKSLNANQLQFINLIVDELTRTGVMEQSRLFESPYIDLAPTGIQTLFGGGLAKGLQAALAKLRESAEAE